MPNEFHPGQNASRPPTVSRSAPEAGTQRAAEPSPRAEQSSPRGGGGQFLKGKGWMAGVVAALGIVLGLAVWFAVGSGKQPSTPKLPAPFTNSLGMKFVPAGTPGVLFCVWDTRVKDYEAFVRATNLSWKRPNFSQSDDHPAVSVSWDDANAFCVWLTEKERREEKLNERQEYRLPMDAEWSVAVGLENEWSGAPNDKDSKIEKVYPWGTQWPPPKGAGNYGPSLNVDEFVNTSPVGSFSPNRYGLYDMGGNVWQWCQDFYDGSSGFRVLRGASCDNVLSDYLLSSCRIRGSPVGSLGNNGFRCVLATRK